MHTRHARATWPLAQPTPTSQAAPTISPVSPYLWAPCVNSGIPTSQPARAFRPQLSPHKFSGLRPAAESVLTAATGGAAPGAERRGQSRRGTRQERPFPGVT